ncbi:hypothetical protein [Leifsonia xyli]|nr:hypothetical protein [Leifsonia xyli]
MTGAAGKQAQAMAILELLTQQTGDATGQFAREANTAEGAAQRSAAQWQNVSAQLGTVLLPVVTWVSQALTDLAGWVSKNTGVATVLAAGVSVLAGGILVLNGAIRAWRTIAEIATAVQWAFNAAMTANPIGLVITAIGLIIAIIIVLVTHWKEVSKVASDVWDGIVGGIKTFIGWIKTAIDWLSRLFGAQQKTTSGGKHATASATASSYGGVPAVFVAGYTGFISPFTASALPSATVVNQNVTITVTGVVTDPEGTARQIRKLLDDSAAIGGRTPAGGRL